jgi:hypothetical protein
MDAAPTCPRKTALSVKNAIWLYCITLLKKTQAVYQKTQYRTSFFYFVHNVWGVGARPTLVECLVVGAKDSPRARVLLPSRPVAAPMAPS